MTPQKKVRVAYLVSHPIQYQAPLLRRISQEADIELTVLFGSDFSVQEYVDKGFGVDVKWDVSLLDGYRHEFLPAIWDKRRTGPTSQLNYGIFSRLRGECHRRWLRCALGAWVFDSECAAGHGGGEVAGDSGLLRAESRLSRTQSRLSSRLPRGCSFYGLKQLVDGVLPIGTSNAAYWRHYLGEDFPQSLMPYAVDNHYFQSRCQEAAAGRDDLQRELDLDPSRPVILFASKLQDRKRCEDLLEAYLNLSPGDGIEPHPYLVIVGDGEERAALEKRAKESGFKRSSLLRVSESIGVAAVLRPCNCLCFAFARRAMGADRERGHECRTGGDRVGRCGLPARPG